MGVRARDGHVRLRDEWVAREECSALSGLVVAHLLPSSQAGQSVLGRSAWALTVFLRKNLCASCAPPWPLLGRSALLLPLADPLA